MMKPWKWYQNCMVVHPVKTQVVSSGFLWAVGDIAAQSISHFTAKNHLKLKLKARDEKFRVNWNRVGISSLFGFTFVGPFGHFWYEGLDKFSRFKLQLHPKSAQFIATKVAMDGLIYGPFNLIAFLTFMGFASGKNARQVKEGLKRDFIPALVMEGGAWPIIQTVNFLYVPVMYQLLYVNVFCMLDSAFLSWLEQQKDAVWKKQFTASFQLKIPQGQSR
ncbi:transporter [Lithospermum erythrorhizon]|uniref:Transporter n=1 Tax=Lithospermum erythrorhizon TaxID=34254 RepID=A0AAV3RKD5_LITER